MGYPLLLSSVKTKYNFLKGKSVVGLSIMRWVPSHPWFPFGYGLFQWW